MIAFWILAAVMTAAVVLAVARPLMRGRPPERDPAAYDLAVYRDQLAELGRDLDRGVIDARQAEAARAEIGRRMLAVEDAHRTADAGTDTRLGAPPPGGARRLGMAIVAMMPMAAIAAYLSMGAPELPGSPLASRVIETPAVPEEVASAVAELEAHLKTAPEDVEGWLVLARTYVRLGRADDAVAAFRRLMDLTDGDPEIATAYAEALTFAAQGMITEEARRIFETVLQQRPLEPRASYYLALARAQAGDFQGALDRWTALAASSPADAPWLEAVRQRIEETATRLGLDVATVMPDPLPPDAPSPDEQAAAIRGMVDGLAARLAEAPDDIDGWMRLGRSYLVLGEGVKAVEAYGEAARRAPQDVAVQLGYAQAMLAVSETERPSAEFLKVMRTVLDLDPDNPQALWHLGAEAERAGRAREAAALWDRLLARLPPGSAEHAEVKARRDGLDPEASGPDQ